MKKLIPLILLIACSNEVSTTQILFTDVYTIPIGGNIVKDVEEVASDGELNDTDSIQEVDTISQDTEETSSQDIEEEETTEQEVIEEISEDTIEPDQIEPPKPVCEDDDGDGWGKNCPSGPDCDDYNPYFNQTCPDCSKQNYFGCPCKGISSPCYSGDPQWINKGVCSVGVQACKNGFWQECVGEVLPQPESCDGKDNNCNGLVDEGVLSPCGTCDLSCQKQTIGPDFGTPFNVDDQKGIKLDQNGYIVLDIGKTSSNLSHIWIANSSENTVSKLNTKTGKEEGRYKICSNPSRTSVDLEGDCWVGCRGDGSITKIIADKAKCLDKNGNGVIETSTDLDGNGTISGNEMVGEDECIKFIVNPDGSTIARAAGVDKENHVWFGFWSSKRLKRLEPNGGQTVDQIDIGCNPYGLVIDQKGIIWVSGRGCNALLRVDPLTKAIQNVGIGAGSPYGINVDSLGNIWVANTTTSSSRYSPTTGQWSTISHGNQSRGVATSNDGYVYIALDSSSAIAKINVVTLILESQISLGSGRYPVGIAVDFDGYVWAVNQQKATATKVNPKTNAVIGEYPVGNGPYTYSDMTGYTLHNYTAPKANFIYTFGLGGWTGTVAEAKTTTEWEEIDIAFETIEDSFIEIRYRVANDLKTIELDAWSQKVGPFPPSLFPHKIPPTKGKYLQVEVFMQAGKNKLSPIIKSLSAKGKTVVMN